jgi:hypothetical protein
MTFNLKALGLALVAFLAMAAAIASTASAQGKLTSDGPVTLKGEDKGSPLTLIGKQTGGAASNALTAFSGKMECASATIAGHKYNVTPHTHILSGATQITVTPQYGKCTLFGKPATVDMNGCDYVIDLEGTTGADKFGVKTTMSCPAGKHIQVTMFDSEAKHGEGNSFCKLTITENAGGYAGLSITDTTNGFVDLNGTVGGITIHEKSESGLCAEATTEKGEIHLDITIEGRNFNGAVKAVSISDEGKFTWSESGVTTWTMFGITTACPGTSYTGHRHNETPHQHIPSGSTTITLTPHYTQAGHNCLIKPVNWTKTVNMNGCDYVVHLGATTGGVAGTYGVTTDIVCPEGNQISWTIWTNSTDETNKPGEPFCIQHIPPQTGMTGLHATDTGSGRFDLGGSLEGTKVVQTKSASHPIFCPAQETIAGKIDIDITVEGLNQAGELTSVSLSD